MRIKTLIYRGYTGTIEGKEGSYWGEVQNIKPEEVFYQGTTQEELELEFKLAIDFFLDKY